MDVGDPALSLPGQAVAPGFAAGQKGDTMSNAFRRLFGLFPQIVFIAALAIPLAPRPVSAEPLLLLFNDNSSQTQEILRKVSKQATLVGINKNGDMEVRRGDLSLVVAYNPPSDVIEPQERLRVAQRQDIPTMNGISIRVNFMF